MTEEQQKEITTQINRMGRVQRIASGWLKKRGGKYHSWKKRHFIIIGKTVLYYANPSDKTPLGVINISKHCVIRSLPSKKKEFRFELDARGKRTFLFVVDSDESRQTWIQNFVKAIQIQDFDGSGNLETWNYPTLHKKEGQKFVNSARKGNTEQVSMWLKKKVDANGLYINNQPENKKPQTALYLACWNNHLKTVKELLICGASPHRPNEDGQQPLYIAARQGYNEIIELLLEYGTYINHQDKDGKTCLFGASENGKTETVKVLLDRGVDTSIVAKNNLTPLHLASQGNHRQIGELLVETNIDARLTCSKFENKTAQQIAEENGYSEMAEIIKYALYQQARNRQKMERAKRAFEKYQKISQEREKIQEKRIELEKKKNSFSKK
ncbi:ankyrin repeat-containing protein [Anaeramoeba flamelloides]|uniref:Ankyrin repeat-containing protein n=1 Tax=Anaeramoeba flamelloides TaxID=1746091 RepID=A0AAV8ABE8_9EUKA|nr:ankyrin repeat-containing protein [Anaeramoeba flamelloides]